MANKLIKASIGVIPEDDRDYYGKKRLDMAGLLLSSCFRQLFKNFTETMQKILKKKIDSGANELDLMQAVKVDIITKGLKTALATGNWGRDKNNDVIK